MGGVLNGISCHKYAKVLIIVWYVNLVESRPFLKKQEVRFKNLYHALENVMNCQSTLPYVTSGCLYRQNLCRKFVRVDCACILHYFLLCKFVWCLSIYPPCFAAVA